MTYVRVGVLLTSWALFVRLFAPGYTQWGVDGLWLLAMLGLALEVRGRTLQPLLALNMSLGQVLPLVVLLAIFAAAWLPFYDNWRWAYTADSVSWYTAGEGPALHGLPQNVLSLRGVDGNFTFLHGLAFNALMFIFEPTLFWHRVGKLIFSILSLVCIYAYVTMTVNQWMALAVVLGLVTNYVWLWFSYVSYPHIDGQIFYFLTLICGTVIWRCPERITAWMLCGLIGGISLFFTQTAWSVVAAVGVLLFFFALVTQRVWAFSLYVTSFVLAATPVLLQFPDFLEMTTRQAASVYDWPYLQRIFLAVLWLPYTSGYHHIGVYGGILRPPLSELYVLGVGLAAVGLVPVFRRTLRVPAAAPVFLLLLLWDAALLTLTNNGYGEPSSKRICNLIPLQLFLALLPLYVLHAWTAPWRWPRRLVLGLGAVAIGAYAVASLLVIVQPAKGLYGVTVFDGLIELRQRFPDRPVRLFSSRDLAAPLLSNESMFNRGYHLRDTLALETSFSTDRLRQACDSGAVICFEPNFDRSKFEEIESSVREDLRPFPILSTSELQCLDCAPP